MVEVNLPLIHILSSFPRKLSYKVACMLIKCKNDSLYEIIWCLFNADSCWRENWVLTMTHSCQSGLSGSVGRASEAKSEGRGFKSLFKQIFALTLKLLIDYILSILAYVWLRLTSLLSIYFRASQGSLVIKLYVCWLNVGMIDCMKLYDMLVQCW